MIEVESLSKSFGEIDAVRELSFSAKTGEILGVLGPNGAGKTTTMRIVCAYLPADSGTVRVDGIDVSQDSLEARRRIGYLPENVPLYPEMRAVDYLRFRAGIKGVPRRDRITRVHEAALRCGVSEVLSQTIRTLSKGYRQRVGLADAIVSNPPVLILDEPTTGLDPNQIVEVRELIKELGESHTVLLCSHSLGEVEELCDRVAIFNRGRIVAQDSPQALRQQLSLQSSTVLELPLPMEDRVAQILEGLGGKPSIEALGDGWLRVSLESGEDPRELLFQRAADAGIVLRELTRRQLTLEQIFRELTIEERKLS